MSGRFWRCGFFPLKWKADLAECSRGSYHVQSIDSNKFLAVRAMRALGSVL